MYTLIKETRVQASVKEVWDFISNPANLNRITPDDLSFSILTDLPDEMVEGMLIHYKVKIPLMGMQDWVSELKQIRPEESFVDEQKVGPYRFWHHYHGIQPTDNGVRIIDRITYEVPFGIIGRIAHALFIRKTLERIFGHREQLFQRLLSSSE